MVDDLNEELMAPRTILGSLGLLSAVIDFCILSTIGMHYQARPFIFPIILIINLPLFIPFFLSFSYPLISGIILVLLGWIPIFLLFFADYVSGSARIIVLLSSLIPAAIGIWIFVIIYKFRSVSKKIEDDEE